MMKINNPAQDTEREQTPFTPPTIMPSKEEVNRLVELRREKVLQHQTSTPTLPTSPTGMPTIAIDASPDELWKPLEPWTSTLPGKPYPIEALPEVVRNAVQEVHEYTQAPIALAANSALVCLATACQAIFDVERDGNLRSPTSIYFLTLAESGERKTTCDKFFSSVITNYQSDAAKEGAPEAKKYRALLAAWEAKLDGLKIAIKNSAQKKHGARDITTLQNELEEHYQHKPEPPRIPNIIRTDDTPENLAYVLAHLWPSVGIISSEGGLVFASRALQKESLVGTLAMYNSLWDGGEWQIGRKGDGSYIVRGARLSIGLQIQPQVMANFREQSNNIIRSIGFLARCLFSYPDSTQGSRPYRAPPERMDQVELFNQLVLKLLRASSLLEDGQLKTLTLPLSAQAREYWVEFHNKIEADLARGGKYEHLRDIASKVADNAARLAAIFSTCRQPPIVNIDVKSMVSGCAVAEWHLQEAQRYLGILTDEEKLLLKNAKAVENRLLALSKKTSTVAFDKRSFMQNLSKTISHNETLLPALEILRSKNRARLTPDGRTIEINPALLASANSSSVPHAEDEV